MLPGVTLSGEGNGRKHFPRGTACARARYSHGNGIRSVHCIRWYDHPFRPLHCHDALHDDGEGWSPVKGRNDRTILEGLSWPSLRLAMM